MLGISPSAWEEAQNAMGERQSAIVVACILQRSANINSAGGYLRGLMSGNSRLAHSHGTDQCGACFRD